VDVSGTDVPPPIASFQDLDLGAALNTNIKRCKYTKPTPVQRYAIPISLAGRDLMACAQTGSGKTGGFLFPTITAMCKRGAIRPPDGGRSRMPYPNCLIMAPTRELASQIFEEARKFCYRTGVRPVVVYGGADIRDQLREIDRGCDMIVATPGRLVDLMERGKMSLSCCRHLILDEADRMLVSAAPPARARARA
jgi:ATP-dependent RNA helicase DDX3X